MGGDHARLLAAGDRAHVNDRKSQDRVAPPPELGDELLLDQRHEMRRGGDGVDAGLGRAAVGGPAFELDIEPFEPFVADSHRVVRRLPDDGPVGLEPALDEGLGAEALHLLVDDRPQRHPPRREPAGVLEENQGAGHGGDGAFHVDASAAVEAAVFDARRKRIPRRAGVRRNGVRMPAKEEMPARPLSVERRDEVRASRAHLDDLRTDAVPAEPGFERANRGLLLAFDARVARRLDHRLQELQDFAIVHRALHRAHYLSSGRRSQELAEFFVNFPAVTDRDNDDQELAASYSIDHPIVRSSQRSQPRQLIGQAAFLFPDRRPKIRWPCG